MYGRYVAKRFGQSSVLGSYLDPLADKVLIGSVVAALGYQVGSPLTLACYQPTSFKTTFNHHHDSIAVKQQFGDNSQATPPISLNNEAQCTSCADSQ